MRRALLCLLAALLLAATSEALLPRPDTPLLRIVDRARAGDALVRVDPVNLERTSPPLGGFRESGGHAYSPDGRLLALGTGFDAPGRLEIIDVEGWRRERLIELGGRGPVWPLAWPDERRLLAAGYADPRRTRIMLLDPVEGRVLSRRVVTGGIRATAVPSGVAMLVSPAKRVGPGPGREGGSRRESPVDLAGPDQRRV